jgi:trimethylamine--corrinoid protein Co-methyltransferase
MRTGVPAFGAIEISLHQAAFNHRTIRTGNSGAVEEYDSPHLCGWRYVNNSCYVEEAMALRGFLRRFKPFEIVTEEQVGQIHEGTLDVLAEAGVKIYNDEALKVYKKGGCKVDFDSKLVQFPPALIEECLRKCPSSFRVKSRNPDHDLVLGLDNVVFFNFPGRDIVDLTTWESRTPTRKEHIDLVTVLDALPTVHFINNYPYFGYQGIPENMKEMEGAALRLAHSTKVTMEIANNDIDRFTFRMANAIGTEIFANPNTSSPLTCYTDQTNACFLAAEYDLPSMIWDGATVGSTAPASIAGAIISSNAEVIPYIVLLQLLKPGARVAVANLVLPQNMKTGAPAFGDICISLHLVAYNQVWRKYGIPMVASSSGVSNSKIVGFQLAYEKTIPSLVAALSGSSAVQIHSSVYGEITAHPVQAILDDDIAHMIGRFMEGIEVSDDSLAVDLINRVGPIPGHFLSEAHTRRWWNREQYVTESADRLTYPEWKNGGRKNDMDYAKEKMEEILSGHTVKPPLTASEEEEIEKILKEAREYFKNNGFISSSEWQEYMKTLKEEGRVYE